jgi:hypothetical protein
MVSKGQMNPMAYLLRSLCLACSFAATFSSLDQEVPTLDVKAALDARTTTDLTASAWVAAACGYSGRIPEVIRVRVLLQSTDRVSYRFADQLSYNMSIENISEAAVRLPWSVADDPSRPIEAALFASVQLSARDAAGAAYQLPGMVLRGWSDLPGSIVTLAPRAVAWVRRVPSRFVNAFPPLASNGFAPPNGGVLALQARLMLQTAPCYWAQPNLSDNTINVAVREQISTRTSEEKWASDRFLEPFVPLVP